jgi:EAL domain-containing protein (putative c-di-GMP-specific phosphodiesterase class I)
MIPTDDPPKRDALPELPRDDDAGEPFDSPDRVLGPAVGATEHWILESRVGVLPGPHRTELHPLPFRIGRAAPSLTMTLSHEHVSKTHAEIYSDGVALRVRDLRSRNGTFLNQQPITDAALHEDDLLRIGPYEFKIVQKDKELPLAAETLPLNRQIAAMHVPELIQTGAVSVIFQPIVLLETGMPVAYEALGRGTLPALSDSPVELLDAAGALGVEAQAQLSRLFRRKAVEIAAALPTPPLLFLNTHPADLEHPGLLESLEQLRRDAPHVPLVVEVHENWLANATLIKWLRRRLAALDIALAFDDFGAGQARLLELAEAPPDYLKFDRRFVTGMESAPESRQRLVASLVAAARELRARTVAEGVETAAEAEACRRAGFAYAQGFYFGKPGPLPGASTSESPAAPGASQ